MSPSPIAAALMAFSDEGALRLVLGEIPCVPLKKIAILCESLKKFSGLQRHCSNFFVPYMPLPLDWALTVSNCRCEESKIPLSLNMSLIFFEHLNDFK